MAAPIAGALGGDVGGSADGGVAVSWTAMVVADGTRGTLADDVGIVPLGG